METFCKEAATPKGAAEEPTREKRRTVHVSCLCWSANRNLASRVTSADHLGVLIGVSLKSSSPCQGQGQMLPIRKNCLRRLK